MNAHEIEERNFGMSGALWDAGEGVCCAAFQLGACAHTEAADDIEDNEDEQLADVSRHELAVATNPDDEPF